MDLKQGERIAKYASITVAILAAAKLFVGYFFNSLALFADGIHSFADLLPISITYFALRIAQRKPNEKFPYGYYKAETIASFGVAIFILALGVEMVYEGIKSLFEVEAMNTFILPLSVSLISAGVSYFLFKYEFSVGKKVNSRALMLDGKEKRIDIFSSLLVFVAIVAQIFGFGYVNGIVALVIAAFVIHIGLEGLHDSVLVLLDAWMDEDKLEKIKKAMKVDNIPISDLKLRKAGPYIFGDAVVAVPAQLNAAQLSNLKDEMLAKAKQIEPKIIDITIEPKVLERRNKVVAIPLDDNDKFSTHFGRAKRFMLIHIADNNIVDKKVINNPEWKRQVRAGLHTAKFLIDNGVTDVISSDMGEISFNTLSAGYVNMWKVKGKSIEEIIDNFIKGNLEKFTEPGHEV